MAEHDPRADLLNVAATLARLSFFAGNDADQISDQTHDNITRLALRTRNARDALVATVDAERARAETAEAEVRALREQLAVLKAAALRVLGTHAPGWGNDGAIAARKALRAATADPTTDPENDRG